MNEAPEHAINLGSDHSYVFTCWEPDRELNPQYEGLPDVERWGAIVFHRNPRTGRPCSGAVTFDGPVQQRLEPDRGRWQVISEEPLHIEPSVLCRFVESVEHGGDGLECGDHGFIRGGRWIET